MGYGLMDKKRNILIRELMGLIDEAKGIQSEIDTVFKAAYEALQSANIELGINYVQEIGMSVPVDDTVKIKARSIMGTEILWCSIRKSLWSWLMGLIIPRRR